MSWRVTRVNKSRGLNWTYSYENVAAQTCDIQLNRFCSAAFSYMYIDSTWHVGMQLEQKYSYQLLFPNRPFSHGWILVQVLTLCTSWVSGYLHQVSTEPMALLIWQYPPSHLDGKHAVLLKEIQTTIIKYYYLATYSQGPHSGLHANTACWTLSAGQETLGSLTAFNPCVLSNLHSSTTCCYKKIQHTQRKCGTAL